MGGKEGKNQHAAIMVSSRKHSFRHMYVILLCPLLQQQCPPAGHLPNPGIKPRTSTSQEDFIYHLSHQGIPRSWSGVPFPPPGNLPNQEIEPASLMSPELAGGCFTTHPLFVAPLFPEYKFVQIHWVLYSFWSEYINTQFSTLSSRITTLLRPCLTTPSVLHLL